GAVRSTTRQRTRRRRTRTHRAGSSLECGCLRRRLRRSSRHWRKSRGSRSDGLLLLVISRALRSATQSYESFLHFQVAPTNGVPVWFFFSPPANKPRPSSARTGASQTRALEIYS